MRRVYHPPQFGTRGPWSLLGGMGLAVSLFVALPMTRFLAQPAGIEPPARQVNTLSLPPPPPPPPPTQLPPREPSTAPNAMLAQVESRMQEPRPRLTLRQLDLALEPALGSINGDFALGFDFALCAGSGLDAFELADVDRRPRPLLQSPPLFPYELRHQRITGNVSVIFIVERDGQVSNIEIEASEHPAMSRATIDAVRRWRFEPGTRDGNAVRIIVRQILEFRLE